MTKRDTEEERLVRQGIGMIAAGAHYVPTPCPCVEQRAPAEVMQAVGENVEGGLWFYYPPTGVDSLRRLGLQDSDEVGKVLRVPPRFWEDIAYQGLGVIQCWYGPLGHPGRRQQKWRSQYESLAWAQEAQGWLRELINLTELWKTRNTDRLRELAASLPRNPTIGEVAHLEECNSQTLIIYPRTAPIDPLNVIRLRPLTASGHWPRVAIRLTWPGDDLTLLSAVWAAILDACGRRLSTLPLTLETFSPIPQWVFDCSGSALEAAFCYWYFEEIASATHPTCEAEGCFNPIPDGRSKYCSTRCANRQRQREHRAEKKRDRGRRAKR